MSGRAVMDIFKRNFPELAEHIVKWVDHHHNNISILVDDGRLFKFQVRGKKYILEGVLRHGENRSTTLKRY